MYSGGDMPADSLAAAEMIRLALADIHEPGECAGIARIVLEDGFGIPYQQQHFPHPLREEDRRRLAEILSRLLRREPVQYVLGRTVFLGLPLEVNPAVLIPRQETEELVAWVLEDLSGAIGQGDAGVSHRVLDIGTGSGCIAIALKARRADLTVEALDVSGAALAVARRNAAANGVSVRFREADILDPAVRAELGTYDIIVSNPPYITLSERTRMAAEVLEHEPGLALFAGGEDAQLFVREIADFARGHLRPGGSLYLEINEFHATESEAVLRTKGFQDLALRRDLNGKYRMLRGSQPPAFFESL
jgi:release factor glutamine methyltransferase